jgi:hypothetical protein
MAQSDDLSLSSGIRMSFPQPKIPNRVSKRYNFVGLPGGGSPILVPSAKSSFNTDFREEIRNEIYKYLFPHDDYQILTTSRHPSSQ